MSNPRYGCLSLAFATAFITSAASCLGQQSNIGLPPLGSYNVQQIDSVNLENLNVHFHIPLFQKQARGYTVSVDLDGDSNAFCGLDTPNQYQVIGCNVVRPGIHRQGKGMIPGGASWSTEVYDCPDDPTGQTLYYYQFDYYMVDDNGTLHNFPGTLLDYTECDYPTGIQVASAGPAVDGSGYFLTINNDSDYDAVVSSPGGLNSNSTYGPYDTNGNIASILPYPSSGEEDSTGAIISQSYSAYSGHPQIYTYTDSNGQQQNITVNCTNMTVYAYFGQTQWGPFYMNGGTQCLTTSVVLPDGTSYQFGYEASPGSPGDTTGRLASVTLPGDGVIGYQYFGGTLGSGIGGSGTAGLIRTTSDGSTTYSSAVTTSNGGESAQTQIQDAQGNQTTVNFQTDANLNWLETSRSGNNGQPSITHSYYMAMPYGGFDPPWQAMSGQPPAGWYQINVITYGINEINTIYNPISLATEVDEYDWVTNSGYPASTPSRKTFTTYATLGNNILNRPSEVLVTDGNGNTMQETTYGYDETSLAQAPANLPNLQAVTGARGNLTSVHQWIGNGSALTTTYSYDSAGAQLSSTDRSGATTTYGYESTDTWVASTTLPATPSGVGLGSAAQWDFNTGLMTSSTDANGVWTQNTYNSVQRPTEIDTYDSGGAQVGKTTYTYTPTQISTHAFQNSGTYADTETLFDGYWRVSRVAVANGQSGNPWYQQDTCYGWNGKVSFQSYKYQGTGFGMSKVCSGSGDSYTYDALGRTTKVAHADGTSFNSVYGGRAMHSTDENGISRIVQLDGLQRLTGVCEISSNGSMPGSGSPASCGTDLGGTGFLTSYAYNASGSPTTTVTQGGQIRTFQTDWAGRPTMDQQPESGQTTYGYSYNSTGLVTTRTRPQANQENQSVTTTTTTQYDVLGRPLSVSYSDGTPSKSYAYDAAQEWGTALQHPKGRLVSQGNSANTATIYSYDALGNVNLLGECTPSKCGSGSFNAPYAYDWLSNALTSSDGFGVTNTYTYSLANEIRSITSSLSDSTHPPNVVSNVLNGPDGPLSWQLGNGLTGVRQYDSMGRITGGWVCQGSSQVGCSGGTQVYGYTSGWTGAYLTSASDTVLGQNNSYGYDQFGRLASLTVNSGTPGGFTYEYDRWGNRWQQNLTSGSGPQPQLSFNTSTNRITNSGFVYDAAGNLTSDSVHSYAYDAESNMTQVDGGATAKNTYDAANRRVRIDWSGDANEFVFNPAGQRTSIWDPVQNNQVQGQTFWGATPAEYYKNGTAHYQHQDWMGTERMGTTFNGQWEGSYVSLPFGDGYSATGADNDPYHFAGLDHDSTSYTDHAQYRQYANVTGRWMSPDPYQGSIDPTNPQSLNRYAYVQNNPLSFVDPTGLVICDYGPGTDGTEDYEDADDDGECLNSGGTVVVLQQTVTVPADSNGNSDYSFQWIEYQNVNSNQQTQIQQSAPKNGRSGFESLFCLGDALKSNGLSLALDTVGLIPEAEGFTKVFENEAGYQIARAVGNSAGYRGVVATQYGMMAVRQGKDGVNAINGALGLGDTSVRGWISTGATIAGFIPFLSTGAAAVSIGVDASKIYDAQSSCLDSGKYD